MPVLFAFNFVFHLIYDLNTIRIRSYNELVKKSFLEHCDVIFKLYQMQT